MTSWSPGLNPLTSTIGAFVVPSISKYALDPASDAAESALHGLRDQRVEPRELREPGTSLAPQLVHELPILLRSVVGHRRVFREVDGRNFLRRLVSPVRIPFPLDPFLRDLLHELGGDPDRDLFPGGAFGRADRAGIQDVSLHVRVGAQNRKEPVSLVRLGSDDEW